MNSYRVRFRIISPRDSMTPLMYLPMQETVVQATDPKAARQPIYAMANKGDDVQIESVELDPHWTEYHRSNP